MTLGVAPGYVSEEFEAFGVPREERFARFEEALDVLMALWTNEESEHQGRHYAHPNLTLSPRPVQQPLPVWYGVSGPKLLRRAATRTQGLAAVVADGVVLPVRSNAVDLVCFAQAWHWLDESTRLARDMRLLSTFSPHRLLAEDRRARLYAGIAEVVDARGGVVGVRLHTALGLGRRRP